MSDSKEAERVKRRLYLTRDCGTCKACCTLMPVLELDKPPGTPCRHLNPGPGKGCGAYETRPDSCRQWACVWRSGSNVVEPSERPDRLGIMVDTPRAASGAPKDVLLVYETEPGGFERAENVIERLARKRAVVFMTGDRRPVGPEDKVSAYLDWFSGLQEIS